MRSKYAVPIPKSALSNSSYYIGIWFCFLVLIVYRTDLTIEADSTQTSFRMVTAVTNKLYKTFHLFSSWFVFANVISHTASSSSYPSSDQISSWLNTCLHFALPLYCFIIVSKFSPLLFLTLIYTCTYIPPILRKPPHSVWWGVIRIPLSLLIFPLPVTHGMWEDSLLVSVHVVPNIFFYSHILFASDVLLYISYDTYFQTPWPG